MRKKKKVDETIEGERLERMMDDCVYPDWEGGMIRAKHIFRDGFCIICGKTEPVSECEKGQREDEKKEKFDNQKDLK